MYRLRGEQRGAETWTLLRPMSLLVVEQNAVPSKSIQRADFEKEHKSPSGAGASDNGTCSVSRLLQAHPHWSNTTATSLMLP